MTTIEAFYFDPDHLQGLALEHRDEYRRADPFPHVVIDNFLPDAVVDSVLREFPSPDEPTWRRYDNIRERKLEAHHETQLGPYTRHIFNQFNSGVFIDFLEALTGVDGLIPDPHLWGGGLHQIEPGGLLKVHADFNWHDRLLLDRRLNAIVYLNPHWEDQYGGHLELWNSDMTRAVRRILPVLNRCVVFDTTDFAFHGHPDPLRCPDGMTRRSLALYYYSNGRPAEELTELHTTHFRPRPGESWRRERVVKAKYSGRSQRLLPPIVAEFGSSARTLFRLLLPPAAVDAVRGWRLGRAEPDD